MPWRGSELSNMFSSETILPRNLEGEKHSSKAESQCVSYYSGINCWLTALMMSSVMTTDVSPSVDLKKK